MSKTQRLPMSTGGKLIRSFCTSSVRRNISPRVVKENDVVLLKNTNNSNAVDIITLPLRVGGDNPLGRPNPGKDFFNHDDIIGKNFRDLVRSRSRKSGVVCRILEPTLGEYTDSSPRIVTPIYSQDANLIVSLLDLHPAVPGEKTAPEERLEIFEAGTGHGALTLHLARAIHAANTAPPERYDDTNTEIKKTKADETPAYKAWKESRRAVIHTLDKENSHSKHAEKVVQNFRHGMYSGDIEFHVGNIEEYIEGRLKETMNEPFLQYAILDLPQSEYYFEIVGRALKPHSMLLTFCPSITQITSVLLKARKSPAPLWLERVVEIGSGVGVGGREWDVRPVKLKAVGISEPSALQTVESSSEESGSSADVETIAKKTITSNVDPETTGPMICRPAVGRRVVGGGFVGVWRRMES